MNITPDLLTANGWYRVYDGTYQKPVVPHVRVWIYPKSNTVHLEMGTRRITLPAVCTMEHLSLLFTLLGDAPPDTYSASLETLPAFARGDARAVDRILEGMVT